jgi:hypothetical protein
VNPGVLDGGFDGWTLLGVALELVAGSRSLVRRGKCALLATIARQLADAGLLSAWHPSAGQFDHPGKHGIRAVLGGQLLAQVSARQRQQPAQLAVRFQCCGCR